MDFKVRTVYDDDKVIKLQVWDPAYLHHSYFKGVHGILIVYDISDHISFEGIESWLSQIKAHDHALASQILVGNKSDLSSKRAVTALRALEFAGTNQLRFIETSANDGINIESVFLALVRMVLLRSASSEQSTIVDSEICQICHGKACSCNYLVVSRQLCNENDA